MLKSKSSRWLAGPYLVWMAIFTVVPLFIVIWYAMTNADGQFTFDNLTRYRQSIDAITPLVKKIKVLGEYEEKE